MPTVRARRHTECKVAVRESGFRSVVFMAMINYVALTLGCHAQAVVFQRGISVAREQSEPRVGVRREEKLRVNLGVQRVKLRGRSAVGEPVVNLSVEQI